MADHHDHAYSPEAHYQYQYAVADSYHGTNFGASESRDGYATKGEYHVALPDGRTQIVTYHVADDYSGYIADVRYDGKAHYEPHHPAKAHGPAYHPAPVKPHGPAYHPAPAKHHGPAYHPAPIKPHGPAYHPIPAYHV